MVRSPRTALFDQNWHSGIRKINACKSFEMHEDVALERRISYRCLAALLFSCHHEESRNQPKLMPKIKASSYELLLLYIFMDFCSFM